MIIEVIIIIINIFIYFVDGTEFISDVKNIFIFYIIYTVKYKLDDLLHTLAILLPR